MYCHVILVYQNIIWRKVGVSSFILCNVLAKVVKVKLKKIANYAIRI